MPRPLPLKIFRRAQHGALLAAPHRRPSAKSPPDAASTPTPRRERPRIFLNDDGGTTARPPGLTLLLMGLAAPPTALALRAFFDRLNGPEGRPNLVQ